MILHPNDPPFLPSFLPSPFFIKKKFSHPYIFSSRFSIVDFGVSNSPLFSLSRAPFMWKGVKWGWKGE
jgi:hypothetical protein